LADILGQTFFNDLLARLVLPPDADWERDNKPLSLAAVLHRLILFMLEMKLTGVLEKGKASEPQKHTRKPEKTHH
jgi:hypothetical protein